MPECAKCGTACAVGQKFCGGCGTPLGAAADLTKLIDERLAARLKDQKLVELETAQAVVARIGEWTKLFGFFVAVPLGILVIVLTVLGFRQYSDLVQKVQASKQDLSDQLKAIQKDFAEAQATGQTARSEGARLNQDIAEIRKTLDLTQAARIRNELEQLSTRVTGIESRFKINSAGVSSTLERSLTTALGRFADYMEGVGFNAKQAPATVTIESGKGREIGLNSYYSVGDAKVVVNAAIGNLETDPSMVLWPYAQHLMLLVNKALVMAGDGPAQALSNAVPDYFVASYLDEPRLGRGFPGAPKGYLRNADNDRKFDPAVTEPHDVGEIWAGVFWTIRKAAGQRAGDRIVFAYWKSLRPADVADRTGAAAARRLVEAAQQAEGGKYTAIVRDTLQARSLKF